MGATKSHTVRSVMGSSLAELGEAEWAMIVEAHEEYMRRGSFERVFPNQDCIFPSPKKEPSQIFRNILRCDSYVLRRLESGKTLTFKKSIAIISYDLEASLFVFKNARCICVVKPTKGLPELTIP